MFDIGWTEMFVVLVVAVIVIGPKDLPRTLRTVGQWAGKVRRMGRDFQRGLDDMIRETELDEVKKQLEATRKLNLKKEIENAIDPTGSIKEAMQPVKLPDFDGKTPDSEKAAESGSPPTTAEAGAVKGAVLPSKPQAGGASPPANETIPSTGAKTGT